MKQTIISPAERFWAAISYLGILVFFPLFFKIKGKYVYFHNRQGLAIFFASAFFSLFAPISDVGLLIGFLGWSICSIFSIIGLISALVGKKVSLPIFTQLAKLLFKF